MLLVLPEQLTLSYMHSLILGLYISYLGCFAQTETRYDLIWLHLEKNRIF